jgi:hypothetical protein
MYAERMYPGNARIRAIPPPLQKHALSWQSKQEKNRLRPVVCIRVKDLK